MKRILYDTGPRVVARWSPPPEREENIDDWLEYVKVYLEQHLLIAEKIFFYNLFGIFKCSFKTKTETPFSYNKKVYIDSLTLETVLCLSAQMLLPWVLMLTT